MYLLKRMKVKISLKKITSLYPLKETKKKKISLVFRRQLVDHPGIRQHFLPVSWYRLGEGCFASKQSDWNAYSQGVRRLNSFFPSVVNLFTEFQQTRAIIAILLIRHLLVFLSCYYMAPQAHFLSKVDWSRFPPMPFICKNPKRVTNGEEGRLRYRVHVSNVRRERPHSLDPRSRGVPSSR